MVKTSDSDLSRLRSRVTQRETGEQRARVLVLNCRATKLLLMSVRRPQRLE